MKARRAEVVVVGAGIVGLATGYELRRRDVDVRVIEAARPGSGQSAGRTRIFRHNHDRPELVARAIEARAGWEEWEAALGTRLLGHEGVLVTGPAVEARAELLRDAGAPVRLLDGEAQREALPILRPPAGPALLDELGGSTDVRASIQGLADALGERVEPGEVFALDAGDPARVETSEGVWEAGRVVLCAGVGVLGLAPAIGLDIQLSLALHARVAFRVRDESLAGRMACLQEQSGEFGETVYAAPFPGEPVYAVGLSGTGSEVPFGAEREAATAPLVERIVAYAGRALPGLDSDPAGVRLCLQSLLPEGPDVSQIWTTGSVVAFAGDNLFKFAPLLGRELADAALGV